MKEKSNTQTILQVLLVFTWIGFIGLLIKTGAILFTFALSWFKPEAASNLYQGLDYSSLKEMGNSIYIHFVAWQVVVLAIKANMLLIVIKILSKINLSNPFTQNMVKKTEQLSYSLLTIWIFSVVSKVVINLLLKSQLKVVLELGFDGEGFLFAAGMVFVLSQVFKRGVEIQSENELMV